NSRSSSTLSTRRPVRSARRGGLLPTAGRVEAIDVVVGADGGVSKTTLESVEKIVEGLSGDELKHGNLYVKAIKKILAKGSAYVTKEIARLENMLKDDNVTPQKKTLFLLRKNILEALKAEA
ncbi:hypothetical protein SPRG_16443, partial [Saprolegnia parasitica CBS 223.65]